MAAVSGGFTFDGQTLTGSGAVTGNVTDSGSSIISPGDGLGTLTFNQDLTLAGGNVAYEINSTLANPANADRLNVIGNFNYNSGVTTINILANKVVSGTAYTFASVTGMLNGALSNLSPDTGDTRYTFTTSLVGKNVLLTASGANKSLVWYGYHPDPEFPVLLTWNLHSSTAWNTDTDVFYNADDVTFDDTAPNTTVSIDAVVRPASITVNNATKTYSFTGYGKISGNVGLTKMGTGTLYLSTSTANDYTGDTVLQNGTTVCRASTAYSGLTGNIIVQNGATLNLRLGFPTGDTAPVSTLVKIAGPGYNGQGTCVSVRLPRGLTPES